MDRRPCLEATGWGGEGLARYPAGAGEGSGHHYLVPRPARMGAVDIAGESAALLIITEADGDEADEKSHPCRGAGCHGEQVNDQTGRLPSGLLRSQPVTRWI